MRIKYSLAFYNGINLTTKINLKMQKLTTKSKRLTAKTDFGLPWVTHNGLEVKAIFLPNGIPMSLMGHA